VYPAGYYYCVCLTLFKYLSKNKYLQREAYAVMIERIVNAVSSNLIQVAITSAIIAAGVATFYVFAVPVNSVTYP
jgi:hypothetical protein